MIVKYKHSTFGPWLQSQYVFIQNHKDIKDTGGSQMVTLNRASGYFPPGTAEGSFLLIEIDRS